MWGDGFAEILAKGDQKVVINFPMASWKFFSKDPFALLGSFCFNKSKTVGNPVNVGIHANSVFIVPEGQDEIGGFPSDPF